MSQLSDAEVVVVGAGITGSGCALRLARRGHQVLLLDRMRESSLDGASHVPRRLYRCTHTDPAIAMLALDALSGWRELETQVGERLLWLTGEWHLGDSATRLVEPAIGASEPGRLDHLRPARLKTTMPARFRPLAGVIEAERAVRAQLQLCREEGVTIRWEHDVVRLSERPRGSVSLLVSGRELTASMVLFACGIGNGRWLSQLGWRGTHTVLWSHTASVGPSLDIAPVVDWDTGYQLVPAAGDSTGMEVGFTGRASAHAVGAPPHVNRTDLSRALGWASGLLNRRLTCHSVTTCGYSRTERDELLVALRERVMVVHACDGQGFKLSPPVCDLVCDIAEGRAPTLAADLVRRWVRIT